MKKTLEKLSKFKSRALISSRHFLLQTNNLIPYFPFIDLTKKNPLHKKREDAKHPGHPFERPQKNFNNFKKEFKKFLRDNQPDDENDDSEESKKKRERIKYLFRIGLALAATSYLLLAFRESFRQAGRPSLAYKEFQEHLKSRQVKLITILKTVSKGSFEQTVEVTLDKETRELPVSNIDAFLSNLESEMKQLGFGQKEAVPVKFRNRLSPDHEFLVILSTCTILTLSLYVIANLTKIKMAFDKMLPSPGKAVRTFEVKKLGGGFETIAGLESAKVEIREFVEFLKNPFMFAQVGARMPKGALLTGAPGTGKTLLAKACAFESGVSFFSVSGSDFVEKYVGIGALNVRKLFEEAKRKAPAVIFIDEIDAIGKKRDEAAFVSNSERENTLNQLLVEMDGFDSKTSLVVLAATNRPGTLDPALTRPGRLDRHIALTLPDLAAREQIFLLYLAKLRIEPESAGYLARRLATLSPGFSGADIANLCNEAAILAAREAKELVSPIFFEEAAERVIAGLRRHDLVSEQERRLVAFHESGHATASWFLEGADPLVKVTIVPRSKGALGFAQYLVDDSSLNTERELRDRIVFALGGRVAEEMFFGRISTGAQDDLQKAFDLAQALVASFGMGKEFPYISLEGEQELNSFIDTRQRKFFSDETQAKIDANIAAIIEESFERCRKLLREKRALVETLAERLLRNESVGLKELIEVFGERPFCSNPNFEEYLKNQETLNNSQK